MTILILNNNDIIYFRPIHDGVIKNDIALVRRMCVALKARKAGVNLENNNGCVSIFKMLALLRIPKTSISW